MKKKREIAWKKLAFCRTTVTNYIIIFVTFFVALISFCQKDSFFPKMDFVGISKRRPSESNSETAPKSNWSLMFSISKNSAQKYTSKKKIKKIDFLLFFDILLKKKRDPSEKLTPQFRPIQRFLWFSTLAKRKKKH